MVIDEAHHATAKTYRKLIAAVQSSVRHFRLLGLTATPFRTAEAEKGFLAKVFPDHIVYKADLRTLVNRGILSEPVFENVDTTINLAALFTPQELNKIQQWDISHLGESAANTIANNSKRNLCIVNRYLEHRDRYQQTIVFALNQPNAVALKALFVQKGVRCDFVISSMQDLRTGASLSSENKQTIQRFRSGELDVLVNVNILTEGTDLPKVQTIFLARPTISPVLMTQMMGRGLRGKEAGGTTQAFIVSFVDDWQEKVAWISPERLYIGESTDFTEPRHATQQKVVQLISISKLEEFALLANNALDRKAREKLENLPFLARVPVGIYHFELLRPSEENYEEALEKRCEILVYSNLQQAYAEFTQSLPDFFGREALADQNYLSLEQLEELSAKVEADFFDGYDLYPGYSRLDIQDVLQYYYQHQDEAMPALVPLQDRGKYDISALAQYIYDHEDWTQRQIKEYENTQWNDNQAEWQVFFGHTKRYFLNELTLALAKLHNPELYQEQPRLRPLDRKEQRPLEELSMAELRLANLPRWRQLSNQVFDKHLDADGYYVSATGELRSRSKLGFQIDHIKALSQGGLTTLENLQLLSRKENAIKGNR